MDKGIIYGVYWKNSRCLRHFYEMEDAIEWCKTEIDKEVGNLYNHLRYCVDEKSVIDGSVRCCLVGYNGGFGNIMKYEIKAIDVY